MKQALMIVTALGLGSLSQANASVANSKVQAKYAGNSEVQIDATGEISFSADEMSRKIAALQGKYEKPVATSNLQTTNTVAITTRKRAKSSDTLLGLINDLESKASVVTFENDALASYHSNIKAKRLVAAEAKLSKIAKAKKILAKKQTTSKRKTSFKKKVTRTSRKLNSSARPVIAAKRASRSAHSRSKGLCARYVRKALQSAGYKFTPNGSAYQYASRGTLRKAGFVKVSNHSRSQVGDVVVVSRSRAHPHGHISIFDGRNWVSDFRQKNKSPYRKSYSYTTWRDASYTNATSSGLYMASR